MKKCGMNSSAAIHKNAQNGDPCVVKQSPSSKTRELRFFSVNVQSVSKRHNYNNVHMACVKHENMFWGLGRASAAWVEVLQKVMVCQGNVLLCMESGHPEITMCIHYVM